MRPHNKKNVRTLAQKISTAMYEYCASNDDSISNRMPDNEIKYLKDILSEECGHTDEKHGVGVELNKILDRMIDNPSKNSVSRFTSKTNQWDAIRATIANNANIIVDKLNKCNNGENFTLENIIADVGMDNCPIGLGVTRKNGYFQTFKTDVITIVMEKNDNARLGFTLVTAYPSLPEKISDTYQNSVIFDKNPLTCSNAMTQTKNYADASIVKKAYLLYSSVPKNQKNNISVGFSEASEKNGHNDTITIYRPIDNGLTYRIFISDKMVQIRKYDCMGNSLSLGHTNQKQMDLNDAVQKGIVPEINYSDDAYVTSKNIYKSIISLKHDDYKYDISPVIDTLKPKQDEPYMCL